MIATDVFEYLRTLVDQAMGIWVDGGWAMIGIAVIALVMFAVGVRVWSDLRRRGFLAVPESTWRSWIENPSEREGPIGEMLDFAIGGASPSEADVAARFEQLRTTEAAPFERDLRVMKVCVTAAPLVGLLGTVTGMLTTFDALASGSGGDKTMGMIASGISEALITTETGLVVALPGLFFQYQLARKFDQYKAFLAHLETVCAQVLHRRITTGRERAARDRAVREIATTLYDRLVQQAGAVASHQHDRRIHGTR